MMSKILKFLYPLRRDGSSGIPHLAPVEGLDLFMPLSHTFPPFYRTNCLVLGDPGEKCILVDPSPLNRKVFRALLKSLRSLNRTFNEIFITHHHLDHHHLAPALAGLLKVPLSMSRITAEQLLKRHGHSYFRDVEVVQASEGDIITRCNHSDVRVLEVPGHDAGQLALAPDSMEWFLAGDLIQSIGTVVVGGELGDMAEYYRSLERIIQLDPQWVIPSHGNPMKSTSHVKKTLNHRKQREKQILQLYSKGYSPEQMVEIIYRGTNKRLWPLALENIKAHIKAASTSGVSGTEHSLV
jgi:endoribonuclease LACTB2